MVHITKLDGKPCTTGHTGRKLLLHSPIYIDALYIVLKLEPSNTVYYCLLFNDFSRRKQDSIYVPIRPTSTIKHLVSNVYSNTSHISRAHEQILRTNCVPSSAVYLLYVQEYLIFVSLYYISDRKITAITLQQDHNTNHLQVVDPVRRQCCCRCTPLSLQHLDCS